MILSTIILALGFSWLMVETDWLRIRLPYGSIPEENHDHIKRHPRIDTGEVKACSYPETKLLAEMCGFTTTQNKIVKEKWRSINADDFMNNPRCWTSYQQIVIGGHTLTIKATSSKLYDTIAEAVKIADSKPRKFTAKTAPLPNFVEVHRVGSRKEFVETSPKHGYHKIVEEFNTYYKDCLCGKEWLEAHYNDHKDFEPTIELTVNEKSISFNGNYKTGCIKTWVKANKMAWE
jgi:hypothetical protein